MIGPDPTSKQTTDATSLIRLALVLCAIGISTVTAFADDPPSWRPVTPSELQMNAPTVQADADAEAIFWEVWLDDKKESSIYYDHYVRVKIFTARGQERFSKFDIPFVKGKKIENIAARVIKPDGTTVDLNPRDILEREIIKAGRIKVRAKSFAIPGIEPGVIVEYRYRETYKDSWANGIRLVFQHDIPMQKIVFHVRPQKGYSLIPRFFNMPPTPFVEDPTDKGFQMVSQTNVPAYKVEPHMPPEDEVRRWAFLSYTARDPATVWSGLNRRYSDWLKVYAEPTPLIKKKALEITAGAATDAEKLRRIYDFLQKEIKNITFDRNLSEEEREKLDRDWDHAEDVLKTGMGNSIYIELLFASFAKALGYPTALVFSGDRSESFFSPSKHPYTSFVHLACVAVSVQSKWTYFNSSVPYVPYGYLTWNEEGVTAMLIGDGGYWWDNIPITDQDKSPAKRTGKFKLNPDGSLEGTVRIEYFGQQAISRRRDNYLSSDAKRIEDAEAEIKSRLSTAEISNVAIENFNDTTKPLVYSFTVRIPGYAQRTGQRLFFQPGFFEHNSKPVFSSVTRQHSIHFAYPWSETDDVEIRLPDNFDLDSADRPAPVADGRKIGSLNIAMNYDKPTNVLRYHREFHFGGGGNVLFPPTSYLPLRGLFDAIHKADSHMLALRERK